MKLKSNFWTFFGLVLLIGCTKDNCIEKYSIQSWEINTNDTSAFEVYDDKVFLQIGIDELGNDQECLNIASKQLYLELSDSSYYKNDIFIQWLNRKKKIPLKFSGKQKNDLDKRTMLKYEVLFDHQTAKSPLQLFELYGDLFKSNFQLSIQNMETRLEKASRFDLKIIANGTEISIEKMEEDYYNPW